MTAPSEKSHERPTWAKWLALVVFFIPMFPFVVYRGIKMVAAQDSDDPGDLIQEIQKLDRLNQVFRGRYPKMKITYRAKIAEQRVLQNRLKEAQQEFSAIRNELNSPQSEKAKYLRYFCNYWLANIRGDIEQAEYEVRQASKLSYKSRFLGLPEPKGKDDLDLAFDHELIEAAEDAGMSVEEFVREQIVKN